MVNQRVCYITSDSVDMYADGLMKLTVSDAAATSHKTLDLENEGRIASEKKSRIHS